MLEGTADREPEASTGLVITDYEKDGTRVRAQVEAREDSELSLPIFAFDGYAAEVDGQRLEIARGENSRLTVLLPAGTSGALRVWFAGKAVWRVCDAVSLLTLLAAGAAWVMRRRKRMRAMQSDSSCAR